MVSGASFSGLLTEVITRLVSSTTSRSSNVMTRTLVVVSIVTPDGAGAGQDGGEGPDSRRSAWRHGGGPTL